MGSVGGGSGDSGVMEAGSPESWADRAEARIADAGVALTHDAKETLREMITVGSQRDESMAPQELEASLDDVVYRFVDEVRSEGTDEVHKSLFEGIWDRICFYPWCRR
jgi:hypothetical protein